MPVSGQLEGTFSESLLTESEITGFMSGVAKDVLVKMTVSCIMGGLLVAMALLLLLSLIFSPALVLLNIVLFVGTATLVTMVGSTIAVPSLLQWFHDDLRDYHAMVSETVDTVIRIFIETASHLLRMASGYTYNAELTAVQANFETRATANTHIPAVRAL